jgi:hypothetical protein
MRAGYIAARHAQGLWCTRIVRSAGSRSIGRCEVKLSTWFEIFNQHWRNVHLWEKYAGDWDADIKAQNLIELLADKITREISEMETKTLFCPECECENYNETCSCCGAQMKLRALVYHVDDTEIDND